MNTSQDDIVVCLNFNLLERKDVLVNTLVGSGWICVRFFLLLAIHAIIDKQVLILLYVCKDQR